MIEEIKIICETVKYVAWYVVIAWAIVSGIRALGGFR